MKTILYEIETEPYGGDKFYFTNGNHAKRFYGYHENAILKKYPLYYFREDRLYSTYENKPQLLWFEEKILKYEKKCCKLELKILEYERYIEENLK